MRKRLFILSVVLFSSISFLSAQTTFQKTFGSGDMSGNSIKITYDGGYIIAGTTTATGTANADICLIKTDSNGDTLWTKTFGGLNTDYGNSVDQTTDSGYIVAGFMEITTGNWDGYLVKTNSSGNLVWSKIFGGTGYDIATAVHQTIDGGYIVSGGFSITGVPANLIKFNSNGNIVWTRELISSGGANDVKQTSDSGYIVTGSDYSDVFLAKTDASGNFLWSKTYGGTSVDRGGSVQQTMDGGYIITGNIFDGGIGYHYSHLIKTDANGDTLWVKVYGGTVDDRGHCVQQASDGGFIVTGLSSVYNTFISSGDVSLFKTDSIGNALWAKAYSGISNDVGYSFSQTPDGGYIITGLNNYPFIGKNYLYLIKTDSSGNSGCNDTTWMPSVIPYSMQVSVPSFNNSSPAMIATSPVTITGGSGTVNTLCTTVGLNEITSKHLFLIFPNPSSGNFIISFERTIMKGSVEILNILGEKVFAENIFNESKKGINLKNILTGIYFVKVFDGEEYYCKKVIIEQE